METNHDKWKTDPREPDCDDDAEVVPLNRVYGPMIRQLQRDRMRENLIKIFGKSDNIVGDDNG